MVKEKKPSQDFLENKELIKLQTAFEKNEIKVKNKNCMIFSRESDRLHHERELERGRIKSAEIRKTLDRKERGGKW